MKKWSDENLSWALEFLTGAKELTEDIVKNIVSKDAEKLSLLTACSLIHRDKREISLKRVSENIFAKKADMYFTDFSESEKAFIELEIEGADISSITRSGWYMEKMAGDRFAVIFDDEDEPVCYLLHFTDTRCPWIQFPGDTRKVQFQVTYFDEPNEEGFVKRLHGWSQSGKGPFTFKKTGITMSALDRVPSFVLKNFLQEDVVEDDELANVTMQMRDMRLFRNGTNFLARPENEDHVFEISKDVGQETGQAILDGNVIGSVVLKRQTPTRGRLIVTLTTPVEGIGRNHIINMMTSAALCPVEV